MYVDRRILVGGMVEPAFATNIYSSIICFKDDSTIEWSFGVDSGIPATNIANGFNSVSALDYIIDGSEYILASLEWVKSTPEASQLSFLRLLMNRIEDAPLG